MLTRTGCERRQERLLQRMEDDRLDLFVTGELPNCLLPDR